MDRWSNLPVVCRGGIRLDIERQVLGTQYPGAALDLVNYEPSVDGGYRRILGFAKYSTTQVPGTGNILAVQPALDGVFAVRKTGSDNALYYSTGGSWGSVLNTTTRTGTPSKARILPYNIVEEAIVVTDGVNPAGKWDGSNYTHLNGSGAPSAPKYATTFRNRLVLAPGSTASSVVLSAPADDENFNGLDGAVELKVSDTVLGIATFREVLYIFCKNSIHKVEGQTVSNFVVGDVSKEIGCLGHDTIQELGGDVIYLSQTGFRSLAATERFNDLELGVVSRGIQSILTPKLTLDENDYSSVVIPSKNQYRCFFYASGTADGETVNFMGKLTDNPIDPKGQYEWAKLAAVRASCAGHSYDNETELTVFANADDGYVYEMESGNSFDGANIPYRWYSPYMTFSNGQIRKVLHKVDLYTELTGTLDATLAVRFDQSGSNVLQPETIQLGATTSASVYGPSSLYGTATYATTFYPVLKENLVGSGFTAQFRIYGADTKEPHRFDTLDITYAAKGRR